MGKKIWMILVITFMARALGAGALSLSRYVGTPRTDEQPACADNTGRKAVGRNGGGRPGRSIHVSELLRRQVEGAGGERLRSELLRVAVPDESQFVARPRRVRLRLAPGLD